MNEAALGFTFRSRQFLVFCFWLVVGRLLLVVSSVGFVVVLVLFCLISHPLQFLMTILNAFRDLSCHCPRCFLIACCT